MKRKKRVLVVVESSLAYGRKVASGISQYVQERGHWTVHIEDRGIFEIPPLMLDGWDGDGIITRTANLSLSRILNRCNCPIVELLGDGKNSPIEVLPDEEKMSELCIEHFLERGFKNLAFYSFGQSWWSDLRRELFLRASEEKQFTPFCLSETSEEKSVPLPVWKKKYEDAMIRWLKKLPKQIGILAASDSQAMRVLQACQKIGLKVPEEVAILGIDNDTHLCNLLTPPLSSLDQNAVLVGYEAARLLDLKMSGKKKLPELPILIPPLSVVTRRSTEVTAIDDPDVAAALHFIREYATQGIQVADILHEINISKSTLVRQFRHILGRSPKEEITRVRLNHAKYLLEHTNMPIHLVAHRSGLRSSEYFVSMFHKQTGMSPMQYRKKHQKLLSKEDPKTIMPHNSKLFHAIIDGDAKISVEEVHVSLGQGKKPQLLLEHYLIPAMTEVGNKFENGEFFVPELLVAARAMQECMKILDPILKSSGVEKIGRVVIGTVEGDLHDIGKNLVASMLEGSGFEIVDLGVNVSAETFVNAAREKPGTIIGLSALLTTTMPQMKVVIESLEKAQIRGQVKVIIGDVLFIPSTEQLIQFTGIKAEER